MAKMFIFLTRLDSLEATNLARAIRADHSSFHAYDSRTRDRFW